MINKEGEVTHHQAHANHEKQHVSSVNLQLKVTVSLLHCHRIPTTGPVAITNM